MPPASVGLRLIAHAIDWFWLGAFAAGGYLLLRPMLGEHNPGAAIGIGIGICIDWLLVFRYGQSIGKALMGLRIVTKNFKRVPLWRVVCLRQPAFYAGNATGLLLLFALFMGEERRMFHDRIAGTRIVKQEDSEHLYPKRR